MTKQNKKEKLLRCQRPISRTVEGKQRKLEQKWREQKWLRQNKTKSKQNKLNKEDHMKVIQQQKWIISCKKKAAENCLSKSREPIEYNNRVSGGLSFRF